MADPRDTDGTPVADSDPNPEDVAWLEPSHLAIPAWRQAIHDRLEDAGRFRSAVLVTALAGMFATTFPVTILTIALAPIPWWIKPVAMLAHVSLPFTAILLGKMGLPSRESGYIFTYRKLTSYPVLAYPLIMPVVWAFFGMGAAFGLSLGLLAYVYAMIHLGSALRWNRKLFCDMKSKRAPENLKFFEKYREVFRKVYARRGGN